MQINVFFFADAADAAGLRESKIDVAEGSTAGDVVQRLKVDVANLSGKRLLFAVNEEYVTGDTLLKSGDIMAIFTPVSGG